MPEYESSAASSEDLAAKTSDLLETQLDLALGISGQLSADHAEAIYSLACALTSLQGPDA